MSTKPYHHGNLKGELLRVAEEIGREEGPEAISIRQVTRRVGVSPTAAYRHYTDQEELLNAVSNRAVDELIARLNVVLTDHESRPLVADRMMACAWVYFNFAMEEPHMFRCMLAGRSLDLPTVMGGSGGDEEHLEPHVQALREFSECFRIHAQRTDGVSHLQYFMQNALAAWSTVHGFTVLCTTGQMADLPREMKNELAQGVFASAMRGTDFTDVNDPFRNYPDGKPDSDDDT
ncbi:TetR/AcrR family transcriptional regulator [Corynebacterium phoceense]|uniref:TetR/AcrR family transcriptional regulator n=1 Tax=Corynebacterium phoceense TaxID=1686286 RepID=A0A540RA30_9CORY|nr:TetR/AcrR family transcriptional regulator [Corynebacterium phoceense]TQE44602.1 TetR/AcrR family transcriptional regulator [Corynebacterium phoceense]